MTEITASRNERRGDSVMGAHAVTLTGLHKHINANGNGLETSNLMVSLFWYVFIVSFL